MRIIRFEKEKTDLVPFQKYIENFLPSLLLGLCGLIGALVLFFIDDRSAITDQRPNDKRSTSQQQLGK